MMRYQDAIAEAVEIAKVAQTEAGRAGFHNTAAGFIGFRDVFNVAGAIYAAAIAREAPRPDTTVDDFLRRLARDIQRLQCTNQQKEFIKTALRPLLPISSSLHDGVVG